MRKLLVYLRHYKLETILAPLFKMLEASFELMVPLVMASMIDIGIKNRDTGYILSMGAILVLLGVVGLACSITAQYFAAKAAAGFGTELRHDLFSHINRLSFRELDTQGTATLITRLTNDLNQVQSGVNLVLRLFLRSPFIVFGAMVMAFTIDVRAAVIFVVAIPLLSIVVFGIMLLTMPMYKKVQRQLDLVVRATRENLLGARVIRAFNRQQAEALDYEAKSGLLMQLQIGVGKVSALLNPVTYVIINLAVVAVLYVGALQVEAGILLQGEVVALVNYMTQILAELIKLASLIITITKSLACAGRIRDIFDMAPSLSDGRSDGDGTQGEYSVEMEDVSFSYAGSGAEVLSHISMKIRRGETVGIIGGTGSGKTTLVNLIPRFYDVDSGCVLVNGVDVKEYGISDLKQKIGIVPQRAQLFAGTIRDNLRWGKKDAGDREMNAAIETAQATEILEQKEGLDTVLLQGGQNLSGGQRQRLTIARALVRKPEILILDDSASALDFATDARLRAALREKEEGMTVFLVSQRASTIRHADQIFVMEDGEIVGSGKHGDLMESCPVYREICSSQQTGEEVRPA